MDTHKKNLQVSVIEVQPCTSNSTLWQTISSGSWRSSKTFIVTTICLATFTDGFIYGIVVPVYPFLLQNQSQVPEHKLQLATSVLTAAFAISDFITAPLCAWYVDHFRSRHLPWHIGLALVTAGGILFGVSNNFVTLLISRLLQGASSAILYTVGLAVLVENVGKDEVGRYMGSAMSANNLGMIMSPLLGGVLYDRGSKKAVLGVMLGIAGLDVMMRLLMRQNEDLRPSPPSEVAAPKTDDMRKQADWLPKILDTIVVSVAAPEDEKALPRDSIRESSPSSLGSRIGSVPSSLQRTEQVGRFRGVIQLVRSPRVLAALYGCFINEVITTSLCAILPLYTHTLFNWSPLLAGLLFLTLALPGLAGPLAGMLGDKLGPRWVAVAGFIATTPPLVGLMVVDQDKKADVAVLIVLLTLVGSTVIFFLSPLGSDLTVVADDLTETLGMDMYASSFSLLNSALATAGILGPLLVGAVKDGYGWRSACILLGALCLSGAIPCAVFTGTCRDSKSRRNYEGDEEKVWDDGYMQPSSP